MTSGEALIVRFFPNSETTPTATPKRADVQLGRRTFAVSRRYAGHPCQSANQPFFDRFRLSFCYAVMKLFFVSKLSFEILQDFHVWIEQAFR